MSYPTDQFPINTPANVSLSNPVGLVTATIAPTSINTGYVPGTEWMNTTNGVFYKCVSSGISGAVWSQFVPSGFSDVATLTGNSGGAVSASFGNINLLGDATTVNVVGSPGTNTLTISLVGGKVAAQSFVTNLSSPVVPTAAGVLNLNASVTTFTDGGVANTIKTEVQGTNHALFVGRGANTAATTLGVGTNGQILIAATTADPAFATLTSTGSTISYTTGANTLNLDLNIPVTVASGGTGATSFTAYSIITAGTTSTNPFQNVVGVGSTGQVLTSNGAATLPSWQTANVFFTVKSPAVNSAASPYTVLGTDQFIPVTTAGGTVTILLPNAPTTGRVIYIKDSGGSAFTNNITLTTVGGVVLIEAAATYAMKANYQSIAVVFDGTQYWIF